MEQEKCSNVLGQNTENRVNFQLGGLAQRKPSPQRGSRSDAMTRRF